MNYEIPPSPNDKPLNKETQNIIITVPEQKKEGNGCTIYILFFISIMCNILQLLNYLGG